MEIKAIIFPQKKKKSKDSIQATPIVTGSNPLHEFRDAMLKPGSQNLLLPMKAENTVGFQNQVFGLVPSTFKVQSL